MWFVKLDGEIRAGDLPLPLRAQVLAVLASYPIAKQAPPTPHAWGRTTAATAPAATAASMALPPSRNICSPANVARWWPVETMQEVPATALRTAYSSYMLGTSSVGSPAPPRYSI